MALKLENVITGFIIFSVLIGLSFSTYNYIAIEYSITPDYVDSNGKTVIEALNDINFISGFESLKEVITSLFENSDSSGSEFDILGSMKASAIGVVKISTGLLTAPLEIIGVITGFYTIPSSVAVGFGLIVIIYIGYMLLNELLGK